MKKLEEEWLPKPFHTTGGKTDMKQFTREQQNQLQGGKVVVVFEDGTRVKGEAMVFVEEVKGQFIPTGKVGVLYHEPTYSKQVAYYLQ